MKIQDLTPPVAVPEPAWKQQLVEFWQQADDHHKIDLEVTLKMGDAAGARQIIESWQQEVIERKKKKSRPAKKKKSRVRYGYGGYWTPGYNFGGTELGAEGGGDGGGGGESVREASTPDGVSPSTKMFLEQDAESVADVIQNFVGYCVGELGITQAPRLQLRRDPAWSQRNRSFGRFDPATNRLDISTADRHVMDVLRTVAHELVHHHQQEQQDLPADAGETGSAYENEANARAGELMRSYGRAHPELFGSTDLEEDWKQRLGSAALAAACVVGTPGCATTGQLAQGAQIAARTAQTMQGRNIKDIARAELEQEIKNYARAQRGDANAQNLSRIYQAQRRAQQNESSGYIPTKKEQNDPRFLMALSPDVRPGATGKNANKMALKTDAQGRPQVAKANGLVESLKQDLARFKTAEDYSADTPPGPEIPPTMPAGTVRVGVSDVYDWYKLGQHIPNLKGLGKHDFGAGPPDSIISFGDEETEHKFIQDLEKTGLDVIDVDPADPAQPAGMRQIKTDPTYNVSESLQQEFELLEQEFLGEINMSPSNLERLVRDIDARAGIEFEMIVPNVNVESGEEDREPDYDYDERVESIADAERFFDDGDYNGSRAVRRMVESMTEDYENWKMEQLDEKWSSEGKDFLRDYIFNNGIFDRDDYMDAAQEYVRRLYGDDPVDEQSDQFLDGVTERLDDLADQFADAAWEDQDNGYSEAYEEFTIEHEDDWDESEWLGSEGYRYMTDIQNNYDIEWPHWQTIGGDEEMDIDSVADDFSRAIGRPVNASKSYHGGRREAGHYVVEPDGSLDPDNDEDGGLEFVSPPLPLDELLSDMDKVREWAKERGCYTNDSTGLHMNVSVPNTSTSKLDYVKLALLLGDERVLNEFGRATNTYTKSAMGKIRDLLKKNPNAAEEVLNKMRGHMEALATKVIHTGNTDKYTSINTKDNYVEFRSPGGDWLDANWDKVKPTLLRTVVALDAAMDPEKYRKEYQKKLYKLLDGAQKQTPESTRVNQLLSMYFTADNEGSGRDAARKLAKELLARRELSKDVGKPGKQFWWAVWKNGKGADGAGVEVVAATDGEALDKAAKEFGLASADSMPRADVELLRPYQAPDADPAATSGQGNWGIWMQGPGRFARQPGEYPAGQEIPVRRFPSREAAEQWIAQTRSTNSAMRTDIQVREIEPSVQNTGSTTSGEWGVWVPSLDRYATIANAGPRRFETKAEAQAWIEDYNQRRPGNDLELQASKIVNTFRAFDVGSGNTVGTFQASGPEGSQSANVAFSQYMQSIGRTNTAGFSYRGYREEESDAVQFREPSSDRGDLTPRGPGPWEIYRLADGASIRNLEQTNRMGAESEARAALGLRGEAPELYGVRTRRAQPAAASGEFTGQWKIVDSNGEEIHRFGGVGNVQADANNVAIRWLQQNPRYMQAGVEVVPVMSE